MFKILIDTCVWLDLAKDYQWQGVIGVLEALVREKQVSIILPRTVVDEFTRNKARVAEEGGRSLSTVLKRAKEVVHKLGAEFSSGERKAGGTPVITGTGSQRALHGLPRFLGRAPFSLASDIPSLQNRGASFLCHLSRRPAGSD